MLASLRISYRNFRVEKLIERSFCSVSARELEEVRKYLEGNRTLDQELELRRRRVDYRAWVCCYLHSEEFVARGSTK
jgi:hypothetical protein